MSNFKKNIEDPTPLEAIQVSGGRSSTEKKRLISNSNRPPRTYCSKVFYLLNFQIIPSHVRIERLNNLYWKFHQWYVWLIMPSLTAFSCFVLKAKQKMIDWFPSLGKTKIPMPAIVLWLSTFGSKLFEFDLNCFAMDIFINSLRERLKYFQSCLNVCSNVSDVPREKVPRIRWLA